MSSLPEVNTYISIIATIYRYLHTIESKKYQLLSLYIHLWTAPTTTWTCDDESGWSSHPNSLETALTFYRGLDTTFSKWALCLYLPRSLSVGEQSHGQKPVFDSTRSWFVAKMRLLHHPMISIAREISRNYR